MINPLNTIKQSLDALEYGFVDEPYQRKEKAAIIAIHAAIEEMENSVLMPRSPDFEMYIAFDRAIGHTSMFISTFDRCYAAMIKEIDSRTEVGADDTATKTSIKYRQYRRIT